jgi:hypothetical protein
VIYTHTFNGLTVQTGDILCMRNGARYNWFSRFWAMVGYLVPGPVDHTALYVGPGGRCVEALTKGVIDFVMPGDRWEAKRVAAKRLYYDTLVGVAYPLQGLGLSPQEERRIRTGVADYCLAQVGKPYNANFLNTVTDEAFYCSQLIYLAYRELGIDLGVSPIRLVAESADKHTQPLLILPVALMENCSHQFVRPQHL